MLLFQGPENIFGACSYVSLATQLSNALDPLERGWNRQNTALGFFREIAVYLLQWYPRPEAYLSESLEAELWVDLSGRVLTSGQVHWV